LFRETATHFENPTRTRLETHSIEMTLGFGANRGYKCRARRHLRDRFQAHRRHMAARKLTSSVASIAQGVRHVIAWVTGYIVVLWLAQGSLPFDRPAITRLPFALQLLMPTIGMIEIFVLMALTFLLTRTRTIPDMAARAPDRRAALRETVGVLAYATLGQIGGWVVGPALGYRPFSFHIAGTVFGSSVPPARTEVCVWAPPSSTVLIADPVSFR